MKALYNSAIIGEISKLISKEDLFMFNQIVKLALARIETRSLEENLLHLSKIIRETNEESRKMFHKLFYGVYFEDFIEVA